MRLIRPAAALAAGLLAAACSGSPTVPGPPASVGTVLTLLDRVPTGDRQADAAALDSVRRTIRALAATERCADGACASLAVGAKPCGGPWEYVRYCPTGPSADRLRAMAAELARVEQAYNTRYGIASRCDVAPQIAGCPAAP